MEIYKYRNYKTYLKEAIENVARRGFKTELAKAAGCTQSYLSQVINANPELTPDQALAIAEFLRLDSGETDFFLTLVDLSRAGTPRLKKRLQGKLERALEERLRTVSAVERDERHKLSTAESDFYYSKWYHVAIHILTACEDFQRPEQIASRLALPVREVELALQEMLLYKLVEKKDGGRYVHSGQNIHLPTHSLHNQVNHLNWRLRALQSAHDPGVIHYTSVFALSREEWDELKTHILRFLAEQSKRIGQSGSENAYVFCCDLFPA
jgi:uncharacterized protein (TIGR02147 family)